MSQLSESSENVIFGYALNVCKVGEDRCIWLCWKVGAGMYDREHAKAILAEIMSYNPLLEIAVRFEGLAVSKSRLTDEQRFLIKQHKDELIWYLSAPPEIVGICRRGHAIKWRCTPGGTWVCACFFVAWRPRRYPDLVDYWESGRAAR